MSRHHGCAVAGLAATFLLAWSPVVAIDLVRSPSEAFPEPIGVTPVDEAPTRTPDAADPTFEEEVMELVNLERWNNGQLPPLKQNDLLDASSETHSNNMAVRDFVMHCDPDTGTLPWDRMIAAGYLYSSAGENIAWGYPDPQAVVGGWMASPSHRANILSTTYRELGVGYVEQPGDQPNVRRSSVGGGSCVPDIFGEGPFTRYWTQNFGKRNTVFPVVINREAHLTESRDVELYLYGSFSEMRMRNENGTWSSWQPFATDTSWQLSAGNGVKTVNVEMRIGATVYGSFDTITLEDTSEIVFIDGFESGDSSVWSAVVP
ncbi:MAG: CAP domain-containing protein [Candidatus Sulfomarinibacteraceae bacterium]